MRIHGPASLLALVLASGCAHFPGVLPPHCAQRPPKPAPPGTPLPEQLGKEDVLRGMKEVQQCVLDCYAYYRHSGVVTTGFMIQRDGRVPGVKIIKMSGPLQGSETADCVIESVRAASFPEFTGPPMWIMYPYMLR